jgi:hypothetical protein
VLVCRIGMPGEYSTVEFIELTSAVPFTLAQLKEFTLARGFIPSLHGATTPPHAFTSVWGRLTVPTCPLPCASGVSLTSPAARCLQSFSGSCMLPRCLCTVQCVVRRFDRCAAASQLSLLHHMPGEGGAGAAVAKPPFATAVLEAQRMKAIEESLGQTHRCVWGSPHTKPGAETPPPPPTRILSPYILLIKALVS